MKFKYKNDEISVDLFAFFRWLPNFKGNGPVFHSLTYEYCFNHFSDYWTEVGSRSALVNFISSRIPGKYGPKYYNQSEIAQRMARLDLGASPGVVLANINQDRLERLIYMFAGVNQSTFWHADMIVFPSQSKESMIKLVTSIPEEIADVYGFADGILHSVNFHQDKG